MSELNSVDKMWLHWIEAQYALADLRYESKRVNIAALKTKVSEPEPAPRRQRGAPNNNQAAAFELDSAAA